MNWSKKKKDGLTVLLSQSRCSFKADKPKLQWNYLLITFVYHLLWNPLWINNPFEPKIIKFIWPLKLEENIETAQHLRLKATQNKHFQIGQKITCFSWFPCLYREFRVIARLSTAKSVFVRPSSVHKHVRTLCQCCAGLWERAFPFQRDDSFGDAEAGRAAGGFWSSLCITSCCGSAAAL